MTRQLLFIVTLVLLVFSCGNDTPKKESPTTEQNTPALEAKEPVKVNYSFETIGSESGWGYNILQNGEAFIRQPNIPSLPGNQGFDSEEKAIKVAEYILNKLSNGIMPPSINKIELDSLGVI
jgi:hypothetical protein